MNYKFIELLYTLFIIIIRHYSIIVKLYNLLDTKMFVFQSYLGINSPWQ